MFWKNNQPVVEATDTQTLAGADVHRANDGAAPAGLVAFVNAAERSPPDTFTTVGTIRRDAN
jgi:hypothetical protein